MQLDPPPPSGSPRSRFWKIVALLSVFACLAAAGVIIHQQREAERMAEEEPLDIAEIMPLPLHEVPALPPSEAAPPKRAPRKSREVYATWYQVPDDSLAKRRAGLKELTAAHDRLPLGTLLRVTHIQNGRSVTVRITDRGIHKHKVKLDICKEAAEQLEMVSEGVARVRIEVLPEEHGASPAEAHAAAPQP
ncbi:MAG: septal ring lytic transglycosylase RlpA family protein [Chthoniobacterales bacterium]